MDENTACNVFGLSTYRTRERKTSGEQNDYGESNSKSPSKPIKDKKVALGIDALLQAASRMANGPILAAKRILT